MKTVAAGIIVVAFVVWAYVLFFGGGPTLRQIGEPCRSHGGVQQWAPRGLMSIPPKVGGIVVCRDGKIGEVKP